MLCYILTMCSEGRLYVKCSYHTHKIIIINISNNNKYSYHIIIMVTTRTITITIMGQEAASEGDGYVHGPVGGDGFTHVYPSPNTSHRTH